jgi:hypothetical protein
LLFMFEGQGHRSRADLLARIDHCIRFLSHWAPHLTGTPVAMSMR